MSKNKTLLILTGLVIMFSACRNDLEYSINLPGEPTGPDSNWVSVIPANAPVIALRNELRGASGNHTVMNYNGIDYETTLSFGLKLQINGSLKASPTSPAATGMIDIEWACPERKGEMIRELAALNSGETERTALVFFIRFSQNGVELKPGSNSQITLEYTPTSNSWNSLDVYTSDKNFPDPASWSRSYDSHAHFESWEQKIVLNTQNTGWVMVAAEENYNSNHHYTVIPTLPAHYTNANSQAYLVIGNKNAVFQLEPDWMNKRFLISNLEDELSGKLIILSKMEDSYYMGEQQIIIQPGQTRDTISPNITPTITTLAAIRNALDNL